MAVIADIIEGSYRQDRDGRRDERVFIVTDVSGPAAARKINATLAAGMPSIGDPHPFDAGMTVVDIDARPEQGENQIARVMVMYSTPDAAGEGVGGTELGDVTFEVSSQSISEESVYDANGALMQTRYRDTRLVISPGGTLGATTAPFRIDTEIVESIQTHRVAVERPTFAWTWSRVEETSGKVQAQLFSGKTNSVVFQGWGPKIVLMRVSSSQMEDNRWRVSYEAIINPRSWMTEIRHSKDGRTPDDIDTARSNFGTPLPGATGGIGATALNGVAFRDSYPTVDLNLLALPEFP